VSVLGVRAKPNEQTQMAWGSFEAQGGLKCEEGPKGGMGE
jgi:hypothetical protein